MKLPRQVLAVNRPSPRPGTGRIRRWGFESLRARSPSAPETAINCSFFETSDIYFDSGDLRVLATLVELQGPPDLSRLPAIKRRSRSRLRLEALPKQVPAVAEVSN